MRLTGEMMDELFGEDETNINVLGWLIRKPEAGLLGEITNKHIPGGICFGMAFAVAQMFDSPTWVNEFPRTGNTVWGLDAPTRPSYGLLRFVTERFSLQFTDELIPVSLGQFLGQAISAHDPSIDITEIRSLIGPGEAAADAGPDALVGRNRSAHRPRLRLGTGARRHDDRLRLQPEQALSRHRVEGLGRPPRRETDEIADRRSQHRQLLEVRRARLGGPRPAPDPLPATKSCRS